MSISGIGAATSADSIWQIQPASSAAVDQSSGSQTRAPLTKDTFTSEFASMLESVQSGDLSGAQSALSSLSAGQPLTSASYSPSSTAPASATQSDLQTLLQAVQGGDLGAAQKALAALQSDTQTQVQSALAPTSAATTAAAPTPAHHHHGHHHHAAPATTSSASPTNDASPFDPTSSSSQSATGADVSAE